MGVFKDISGTTFGRLTVLTLVGKTAHRHSLWQCRCQCGAETVVEKPALVSGKTQSCGCLHDETSALNGKAGATHAMSGTPTYQTWRSMLSRCGDPSNPRHKNYAGRGIKVIDRWNVFEYFLADMGKRPDGMSLDRWPDMNGDYSPSNCRWATPTQQANNRRDNVLFDFDGERQSVPQIARKLGVPERALRYRLYKGMSLTQANSFTNHFSK